MNCPNCESELKKVITQTRYGAKLELNQCFKCGGIWCDNLEMYEVSPKTTRKIDNLDIKKLKSFTPIKKELHCPRCKKILDKFENPYFPKQIKLEYCSGCEGFWLNRGELAEFKKWQEKKIKSSEKKLSEKDQELFEQMNKMMAFNSNTTLDTWGEVGKFLGQPVDRNNLPEFNFNPRTGAGGVLIACVYFILKVLFQAYEEYKNKENKEENNNNFLK